MSSEERQRTIREQGSRPAEAEKAEGARTGRDVLGQQESERQAEDDPASDAPAPASQDDDSKPRPRR